jgi:hypothetical protein
MFAAQTPSPSLLLKKSIRDNYGTYLHTTQYTRPKLSRKCVVDNKIYEILT